MPEQKTPDPDPRHLPNLPVASGPLESSHGCGKASCESPSDEIECNDLALPGSQKVRSSCGADPSHEDSLTRSSQPPASRDGKRERVSIDKLPMARIEPLELAKPAASHSPADNSVKASRQNRDGDLSSSKRRDSAAPTEDKAGAFGFPVHRARRFELSETTRQRRLHRLTCSRCHRPEWHFLPSRHEPNFWLLVVLTLGLVYWVGPFCCVCCGHRHWFRFQQYSRHQQPCNKRLVSKRLLSDRLDRQWKRQTSKHRLYRLLNRWTWPVRKTWKKLGTTILGRDQFRF